MPVFFDSLRFSLTVTGPIFVVLALGIWLRRNGMIGEAFIREGSKLVFNVGLPALLFISVARTDFREATSASMVLFGLASTIALFAGLEWAAQRWIRPAVDRGVVVQGVFRANMGIIGLAYCANAYGQPGIVLCSIYIALMTILFNILSVITLRRSLHGGQGVMPMLRGVATNPLIIGILLGLPVAPLAIPIPDVLMQSGQYFANLTLPLALLCTGASLDFGTLRREFANAAIAAIGKLVMVPVLVILAASALGFRGIELGVLMLLSAAPTAAASYVMVAAMGGNAPLAANIIALTTFGSVFVTSVAITLMRTMGMM